MKARAAIAVAAFWMLGPATAIAETCNPAIHGTYCETDMRRLDSKGRPSVSIPPIQNFGSDLLIGRDQPGTLGAITFQGGGKQCIGLLRRGRCN